MFRLGFKTADCGNCGTHLEANSAILATNYIATIVGATIGAGGCMLVDVYEWPVGKTVLIGGVVFALYCGVAHLVQAAFGAYNVAKSKP